MGVTKGSRLASGRKLHEWTPPVDAIFDASSRGYLSHSRATFKSQHPLLLEDGSLILHSGDGPLAKIDACSRLVWVSNHYFHHSLEPGPEGTYFVPYVIAASPPQEPEGLSYAGRPMAAFRDDGFAELDADGKVLREWSAMDILEKNGYIGLLYGVGKFETDRTHVNDVEPIWTDDPFVRKGDLLVSMRNLSSVMLYRPSSGSVVWLKTGPWLAQHDVDYQGDGKFTVFGNDTVRREVINVTDPSVLGNGRGIPFTGFSAIYEYDRANGAVRKLRDLADVKIYTETQGLHRVLGNGDVFVESTDQNVLYRVGPEGLRWRFVNSIGDQRIGALHWSRYFAREELDLRWLSGLSCQ